MNKPAVLNRCFEILRNSPAETFEIFWEKSSHLTVEVKEGKLDHISQATDQGLSLRVLKDGKMGFAYTFDTSDTALEKTAQTALQIAALMPKDPLQEFHPFEPKSFPEIQNCDDTGFSIPVERKTALAQELEALARKQDARIQRVRKAGFTQHRSETSLMDFKGNTVNHKETLFGAYLVCVAEQAGNAETGYDSRYTTSFGNLDFNSVGLQAAKNAVELLGSSDSAPTMTCPAVFKNSVVGELLGFLTPSFSAENVDKNFSLIANKKGQKVFSSKITIHDNPLLEGGVASSPFDGEGSPSQNKILVKEGVVENFLYDRYYAKKHGTATNGSSKRSSLKGSPQIGASNLYLQNGTTALDKLVSTAANGIYITQLLGLHTANPVTGEFSVGASGLLIENGKITKPVKGFAIAGNICTLLSDVAELGNDFRFWGSIGAPSFLVEKLQVSGK